MALLTAVFSISFVLLINKKTDKDEVSNMTYVFLGIILAQVLIEIGGIILCFESFEKQLLAYIEGLNSR